MLMALRPAPIPPCFPSVPFGALASYSARLQPYSAGIELDDAWPSWRRVAVTTANGDLPVLVPLHCLVLHLRSHPTKTALLSAVAAQVQHCACRNPRPCRPLPIPPFPLFPSVLLVLVSLAVPPLCPPVPLVSLESPWCPPVPLVSLSIPPRVLRCPWPLVSRGSCSGAL